MTILQKLGCGSPDGAFKFVVCDNCNLSYDGGLCRELRRIQPNIKLGIIDEVEEKA